MIDRRSGRLAAAASLVLLLLAVAPARAADEAGILWETTAKTVVEGMPYEMPAQNQKVCAAKDWTQPPPGGDKNCKTSDFKLAGSKATWTVKCTGEMAMTGTGEINFSGTDAYTGEVRFTSAEMKMSVRLTGRKGGTCPNPQ